MPINSKIAKILWLPTIAISLLANSCSSKYEGYSHKNGIYYKLITIGDTINLPHAGDFFCRGKFFFDGFKHFVLADRK